MRHIENVIEDTLLDEFQAVLSRGCIDRQEVKDLSRHLLHIIIEELREYHEAAEDYKKTGGR